jgi:hypothetical protein
MIGPKYLTTPAPEVDEPPRFIPTGNLWIHAPQCGLDDAGVYRLGGARLDHSALLDFAGPEGGPLLLPQVEIGGKPFKLPRPILEMSSGWIPRFRWQAGPMRLTMTVLAPVGERGMGVRLSARGDGDKLQGARIGFRGAWGAFTAGRLSQTELEVRRRVEVSRWTKTLVWEALAGDSLAALGWARDPDGPMRISDSGGEHAFEVWQEFDGQPQLDLTLWIALARDFDGARTGTIHLRRRGWVELFDATAKWLSDRAPTVRDQPEPVQRRVQQNAFFGYFGTQADSLDGERIVLVTSRSPQYYVSGAYWSRDALLWAFPNTLRIDPVRAGETLAVALERYARFPGDHAQYLDGGVLYPGFELDEWAAYLVALERYCNAGHLDLARDPATRQTLLRLLARLDRELGGCGLYASFLNPSDDPVDRPYLVYSNTLTWRGLAGMAIQYRGVDDALAGELESRAHALRSALATHAIVTGPAGPQYAWAVDGEGGFELHDEPSGSLTLLAYYGVQEWREPAIRNTLKWAHSESNKYRIKGKFPGQGSPHFPYPSCFGLANDLLGPKPDEAWSVLGGAPLDQGFACESFDAKTGVVKTGAGFASAAAFLAWAAVESGDGLAAAKRTRT